MLRSIGRHPVGAGAPLFVIAEIGLNHGGSQDKALALVDAAAAAGASAVKLQTLFAEQLVAPRCPAPAHVKTASLRHFFAQFELSLEAHRVVADHARARGLAVMTTPFAESVVPSLDGIGFDAFKIASGDLTYDGLITAVASTGRPLVLSTGMSNVDEVAAAVRTTRGCDVALLHCVSAYPTPLDEQNLAAIATLAQTFRLPVGLSDHGTSRMAVVCAVTLGATIYERHLVLSDDDDAIDSAVSSTPRELEELIGLAAETRRALGSGVKQCQPAESANIQGSRRGLYAARALRAGDRVTRDDIVVLRPATLLPPASVTALVGAMMPRDIQPGEPFLPVDLTRRDGTATRQVA